ncbi:MAG: SpoIID/LytB domain-containing protein [Thermacetogeniaceae bacterium]
MEKMQSKRLRAAVLVVLGVVAVAGMLWRLGPQARKPLPGGSSGGFKMKEPTITLYVNETGQKKRIKMEDYIAGVVAAETNPGWPREVLAAQAILARTFTMHKIAYEKGVPQHGADASTSTEEFQAYDPSRITSEIRRAVEMTRGMVVRYNGRYIRAWFHSNAGGRTATAAEGLDFRKEPTPYIAVVSDPGQNVAPPTSAAGPPTSP